jgi:iron complex outermembrane receptor protein
MPKIRRRPTGAGIKRFGAAGLGAISLALAAGLLAPGHARADTATALNTAVASSDDLARLSLEELANVEITSVSKAAEPLSEATAAIYVITAEDIRRSGATSLPEALRLAPNLEVARIDAVSYAITARGFNSRETSNKLLVMIDGRSIYTGLYSGVAWDTYDVPLNEIERIEVVSGPGGALYGANAVNGVINIVTRNAHDALGVGGVIGGGNEDQRVTAHFGTEFGEGGAARAYVTAFHFGNTFIPGGGELTDHASGVQTGFRADWGAGADSFTFQGDFYHREGANRDALQGIELNGGNLLARWTRTFDSGASFQLQGYYNRDDRDEPSVYSRETTWDIAAQHNFPAFDRHAVAIGAGYRLVDSSYDIPSAFVALLDPPHRDVSLSNVFVYDRITLTDHLSLALALKAENSSLSGLEWLPSARLGWSVDERTFLWARLARAVRTPSRIDRDLTLPGFLAPSRMDDEVLWSYELGYRGRPTDNTSFTVAVYYDDYDDLRTVDTDPLTIVPVRFSNTARGVVYGVEAWGSWDVTDRWRLHGGVAALHKSFEHKPGSLDIGNIASRGDDPDWQAQLRSQYDVTDNVEFDVAARAVDDLGLSGVAGYVAVDARLGWRITDDIELSVAGFNLFDDRHIESDDAGRRREIGRSAFVRLRWRP